MTKRGMELLRLTERFHQVVGEREPGSQAAICQILMEPKLDFLYISLLRTLQSSPPRVDSTVWKLLPLKGTASAKPHCVVLSFWRVRRWRKLFKDPYKDQFEVLFTTCTNDSKMIYCKFGQLQSGLRDQLLQVKEKTELGAPCGQRDADGGGPGPWTGLCPHWRASSVSALWQVLGKQWWKQACPVLRRWPRKKMIMKTIMMTLNITNVYS